MNINDSCRLCEEHFGNGSFTSSLNRKLRQHAVPSIHVFNINNAILLKNKEITSGGGRNVVPSEPNINFIQNFSRIDAPSEQDFFVLCLYYTRTSK